MAFDFEPLLDNNPSLSDIDLSKSWKSIIYVSRITSDLIEAH